MQLVVGRITRPHGVRGEVTVEVRTDEPDRRFAVGMTLATDPPDAGPLTVEAARWHSGRLLITFAGVGDRDQAEELRGTWLTLDPAEAGPTGDPDEFHDFQLIGLTVVTTSGQPVGVVTDVRHFGQDLLVIEPTWPAPGGPPPVRPAQGEPSAVRPAQGEPSAVRPAQGEPSAVRPAQGEPSAVRPAQGEPSAVRPAQGGPPPGAPGDGRGAGQPGQPGPAIRARRGPAAAAADEILVPFVAALVPEVDVAGGRLVIDPPPGLLELGQKPGPGSPAPSRG